jgi:Tol biopolymer transport system component
LAYAWGGEKGDNFDIYVQQIGVGGEPLQLTRHPDADLCPAWSPDGRTIAFLRRSDTGCGIFLVPALGGHERKLIEGLGYRILSHLLDGIPEAAPLPGLRMENL